MCLELGLEWFAWSEIFGVDGTAWKGHGFHLCLHSSVNRKQTNVLHLHNNTLLPVAWKLSGTEMLGEEFSFSQERGVVQPRSAFPLNVHFRAAKPVSYTKRTFKIEVRCLFVFFFCKGKRGGAKSGPTLLICLVGVRCGADNGTDARGGSADTS